MSSQTTTLNLLLLLVSWLLTLLSVLAWRSLKRGVDRLTSGLLLVVAISYAAGVVLFADLAVIVVCAMAALLSYSLHR